MSDTLQTKEKNVPTIWHTIGIGGVTSILAVVLILSIIGYPPTSKENILEILATFARLEFFFIVFACILGAYIGRSSRNSFRALWIGAIIGMIVSMIVMLVRILVFCCN